MGTNYYLHHATALCPTCHRSDESGLHIGKSSGGWCFALRVHPDRGINSLEDWETLWNATDKFKIVDEYRDEIPVELMRAVITERQWKQEPDSHDPKWLADNYAVEGPNGLARSAIGGTCIAHGTGTWDLMDGEFS